MMTNDRITKTLVGMFGFHAFRAHQEDIVRAILQRRDAFAVMPTGGGKSLCYQLPARLMDGVCVVVSPLISLMKDQVDAARANGLRAATLNSTISPAERNDIGAALRQGEMDLLYISPERFNSEHFIERLKTLEISFFAIDEAHCISEWGHDFRPDYLALSRIADEFPDVPMAAFTATATDRVAEDIVSRLKLREPHRTRASFNRPNLFYRVEPKRKIDEQLRDVVSRHAGESGIIYRTSRRKVEESAAMLKSYGFSALPYHAGMSDVDRHAAQEAFRRDECSIIVATIAFGMGIDKSNVRFVVHADLPKNIEGYYQETGRAGRDGAPAHCVLFFGRQDVAILLKFAEEIEDEQARETAKTQLYQMIRFAEQDACRRTALLAYFGEEYPQDHCDGCDFCRNEVERVDATIPAQKILSAIYRTGERFGAVHICDIVIGADTEKIRDFRHHELPTFGVGKDRPKNYWRAVVEALRAQKILFVDDPMRPALKLTEEARSILKSRQKFQMVPWQEPSKNKKDAADKSAAGKSAANAPVAGLDAFGESVFAELKKYRSEVARRENLPPYIVFSDRTLLELAAYLPKNENELLRINGIGQRKLERYGKDVLETIGRLCGQNPGEAEMSGHPLPEMSLPERSSSECSPTHLETLHRFENGETIEEIATRRKMTRGTIVSHIERLAQSGHEFECERFFTPERFKQVAAWFHENGCIEESGLIRLKPAVEASAGELDYEEARLARIFLSGRLDRSSGE